MRGYRSALLLVLVFWSAASCSPVAKGEAVDMGSTEDEGTEVIAGDSTADAAEDITADTEDITTDAGDCTADTEDITTDTGDITTDAEDITADAGDIIVDIVEDGSALTCRDGDPIEGQPSLALEPGYSGTLPGLTDIDFLPGDDRIIFVTAQHEGKVLIIENGQLRDTPFLDISDKISGGPEQGLLGLAFHPKFPTDRRFFVHYTDLDGSIHISAFAVPDSLPLTADTMSEQTLLVITKPQANHNGGGLRFGPDGFLYISTGDGGGGGDAHGEIGNAQNRQVLLGKILRIDVNGASADKPYAIPTSNPYLSDPLALPEIFHWGLRNPWRFSFDRMTGDMWISDVGQDSWEEMDFAGSGQTGLNFGWRCKEGFSPYVNDAHCAQEKLVDPVFVKQTDGPEGFCSIVVGYMYRGCRMPGYHGTVFYGDWCSEQLRAFDWSGSSFSNDRQITAVTLSHLSSWAEDQQGELWLVTTDGAIFKLVPAE